MFLEIIIPHLVTSQPYLVELIMMLAVSMQLLAEEQKILLPKPNPPCREDLITKQLLIKQLSAVVSITSAVVKNVPLLVVNLTLLLAANPSSRVALTTKLRVKEL